MEMITNMGSLLDFVRQPWHWAVSGTAIALTMALLIWMGRSFGVSTSFKAICSAAGAGKRIKFFDINLKDEFWRLSFVAGGLFGGFLTARFLQSPDAVAISESTINYLSTLGLDYPESDKMGRGFVPTELFNFTSLKGIVLALAGGFLVGFGARYGDGCTSGHAITGLSNLQLPSLITVIGFFIGGLLMTHLIFPLLMGL